MMSDLCGSAPRVPSTYARIRHQKDARATGRRRASEKLPRTGCFMLTKSLDPQLCQARGRAARSRVEWIDIRGTGLPGLVNEVR